MCGDVVDGGKAEYYSTAKKIFDYMIDKTEGLDVEFVMVPGNHDLCNGKFYDFDKFVKLYCPKQDEFEKNVKQVLESILITHHSPISEDATDGASIRHMPRLLDVINREKIGFHLHGHTHGTYPTKIGNECNSIGVGALLLKVEEMGSQFNLITYDGQSITSICNYLYRIDMDKYMSCPVWTKQKEKLSMPEVEVAESAWECQAVVDYIPRLVDPYDVVQSGGISLYYHREQIKTLSEILKTGNKAYGRQSTS